ncbi:hypothetical protein [Brassicibacter mesophilus]|uniref:hypothetical protein n=1 Tax=Brassicibacter mesophilus TaxID=745119 RepID=UPI003D238130
MSKKIAIVIMVFFICIPFAATAISDGNSIEPRYIPVEANMDPNHQHVFDDMPEAYFDGEWGGGPTGDYHVEVSYGDGSSGENYYTHSTSGFYNHHYNTNKSSGYEWTVKLTVTDGNSTDTDRVVVERY